MTKLKFFLWIAVLAIALTGCRNRCVPVGGNWIGASPTIAPPPTYSLNIPSVARNAQPYYTPGGAGVVNPSAQAPTPVTGTNGWRPTDGNNQGANNAPATGTGNSVLENNQPTKFVERTQPSQPATIPGQPIIRTASTAPLPGTGISTTNSRNYSTTSVDERNDATRLPVTDASAVRAPARTNPVAQPQAYVGRFSTPVAYQQTYAAQSGFYRQTTPSYTGAAVLVPGHPVVAAQPVISNQPVYYSGQPVLTNANGYVAQPVVTQATAVPNRTQSRWRDRELGSEAW